MLHLRNVPEAVSAVLDRIGEEEIVDRIWSHDHTVWKSDPTEVANRLGWLHLPETMSQGLDRARRFAADVCEEAVRDVLLLGMGGSSLAPETLSAAFGAPRKVMESKTSSVVFELRPGGRSVSMFVELFTPKVDDASPVLSITVRGNDPA